MTTALIEKVDVNVSAGESFYRRTKCKEKKLPESKGMCWLKSRSKVP